MNLKKIVIFTAEKFPYGMAATNRIISYGKGFIVHGIDVEVVCFRRTENRNSVFNKEAKGKYQGISFKYLSKSPVKSKSFLLRRWHNFLSYLSILNYSIKHLDQNTASIYYSDRTIPAFLVFIVNKIKKGVFLKEESEHPNVYLKTKGVLPRFFFKNYHYRLFDAYLLMTKTLVNYFKDHYKKPILQVPMTVELDRFNNKRTTLKKNGIYKVVYTGVLDDNKDGIDILIKAFSEVVQKYDNYELDLYGSAQSQDSMKKYLDMVKELNVSDKIYFKGRVSREIITDVLLEAKILVLPRPDSLQARNGFPTKLGEYLATGNPTIVTDVGEIPDYLTDNQDTFMAKNNNVDSLKNKFIELMADYERAKEIGKQGRKKAEEYFSNINQTKNIIDFLKTSFS